MFWEERAFWAREERGQRKAGGGRGDWSTGVRSRHLGWGGHVGVTWKAFKVPDVQALLQTS